MVQPEGFEETGQENKVCLLKRSLYELKRAARSWNKTIHTAIMEQGFIQSKSDTCLYSKMENLFVLIYVNDIIVASNTVEAIENLAEKLKDKFEFKCLGDIQHYLGIHVRKDKQGNYFISQAKYIAGLTDSMGLVNEKPSSIPMDPGYHKLNHDKEFEDKDTDHKMIGKLQYISVNSRPDISNCFSILSRKVLWIRPN